MLTASFSDVEALCREEAAWEKLRNKNRIGVDWHFTAKDLRLELKRLSPQIQMNRGTASFKPVNGDFFQPCVAGDQS